MAGPPGWAPPQRPTTAPPYWPGYPQAGWAPPRKSGNTIWVVLGSVAAALVLLVGIGAVAGSHSKQNTESRTYPTYASYPPPNTRDLTTATVPALPSDTNHYTEPGTETSEPETQTSEPETTPPTTRSTTKKAPPPKRPVGYGTPEANKLYSTGSMSGIGCSANLRSNSPSAFKSYSLKLLSCLNRAWSAQLARIGLKLVAPHAVFSNSSKQSASPCGSTGNIGYVPFAFYCSVNQTMYFSTYAAARLPLSNYREYLMATPAHEYGHHIQQVLGIMGVYSQRYEDAYPSVAATTLLSRRIELQAQCFEGLFVGRNYGSMALNAGRLADSEAHTGDNAVAGYKTHPAYRTHGSYTSNNYWSTLQGFNSGSGGHCNTWKAATSTVS